MRFLAVRCGLLLIASSPLMGNVIDLSNYSGCARVFCPSPLMGEVRWATSFPTISSPLPRWERLGEGGEKGNSTPSPNPSHAGEGDKLAGDKGVLKNPRFREPDEEVFSFSNMGGANLPLGRLPASVKAQVRLVRGNLLGEKREDGVYATWILTDPGGPQLEKPLSQCHCPRRGGPQLLRASIKRAWSGQLPPEQKPLSAAQTGLKFLPLVEVWLSPIPNSEEPFMGSSACAVRRGWWQGLLVC